MFFSLPGSLLLLIFLLCLSFETRSGFALSSHWEREREKERERKRERERSEREK